MLTLTGFTYGTEEASSQAMKRVDQSAKEGSEVSWVLASGVHYWGHVSRLSTVHTQEIRFQSYSRIVLSSEFPYFRISEFYFSSPTVLAKKAEIPGVMQLYSAFSGGRVKVVIFQNDFFPFLPPTVGGKEGNSEI